MLRKEQDYEYFIIIILCFLVLVGASYLFYNYLQMDAEIPEIESVESGYSSVVEEGEVSSEDKIVIHVGGAVKNPGVYMISSDSRAHNALEAAGGPLPSASLDALNLAAPLYDGQKLVVPFTADEGAGITKDSSQSSNLININQADVGDLAELPGIGPAIGERIVSYREEEGHFENLEDIMNVQGIGIKTYEGLEDQITLY